MSDALPLPSRPDLGQYRKLARDLQRAANSGDPAAIRAWASRWPGKAGRVQNLWDRMRKSKDPARPCALTDAQYFLARAHGFDSWPKFARHVEALAVADSTVALFESAVDAVVAGDTATLRSLLRNHPDLVRMRSMRDHRSTLLHYCSANGVEDFRQKTPPNIVEIATLLLDAGAAVNAESDAYGGSSTALNLTATSIHPQAAGVQLDLLDLLLRSGAVIDPSRNGSDVNACLHNGRGAAAAFLADRGARLDLEGAAGVGRLDLVPALFDAATPKQRTDAFAWACEFGRAGVVAWFLDHGMDPNAPVPHNAQTGLHWAAYGGYVETVRVLLDRGANVNARDGSFDGTPLEWALYGWGNPPESVERPWHDIVALLARAGGTLDPEWFHETDAERRRAIRKLRADPRMQAALRGE